MVLLTSTLLKLSIYDIIYNMSRLRRLKEVEPKHVSIAANVALAGLYLVQSIRNRKKQRAAEAEIQRLDYESTHDNLTGLLNRNGFTREAQRKMHNHPHPENLALLVFDLDNFKSLNDRFKHDVGDLGLKVFGKFLETHLREGDLTGYNMAGRMGGDEFFALVDLTPRTEAGRSMSREERQDNLVARLNEGFQQDVIGEDPRFEETELGVSIGVSPYSGLDLEQWIREADSIMYEQKAAHKAVRA